MNLRKFIKTSKILNVSYDESTLYQEEFLYQNDFKKASYIVTDVDQELLFLIQFHECVDLRAIKLYALSPPDIDDDAQQDADQPSPPKKVLIFKMKNLNFNFSDANKIKPTHSISCSLKKLIKGQVINLQKKSKFIKTQYLAILIKSNQEDTEKTFLNGIILNGHCDTSRKYHDRDQDTIRENVIWKKEQIRRDLEIKMKEIEKRKFELMLASKPKVSRNENLNEIYHTLDQWIVFVI